MDLVLAMLAGVLSALGVLKLLEWAMHKAGQPKTRAEPAASRRGCIQMGAAATIGAIVGAYSDRRDAQKEEGRRYLEDLDVKLLQFKGLTESAMEIASHGRRSAQLSDALESYFAKYTAEIDELIRTADSVMTQDHVQEVERLWSETKRQVEMMGAMGIASAESSPLCVEVLRSTGDIRAFIREEYKRYD